MTVILLGVFLRWLMISFSSRHGEFMNMFSVCNIAKTTQRSSTYEAVESSALLFVGKTGNINWFWFQCTKKGISINVISSHESMVAL